MSNIKKGIVVISFGTSYEKARKLNIKSVEEKIAKEFKDYEIRRAFTSFRVINKLKNRDGIFIDNPSEALDKMKLEGFNEVIIQPLHLIPGYEYYEKIVSVYKEYESNFNSLKLGYPLLYSVEDYKLTVNAIKSQLPELNDNTAVVMMGHGTHHHANACYPCLQNFINNEKLNVYIATVEGYPELDIVIPKLKDKKIKNIILMPLMLVAGDHIINDMASQDEDSWKSILEEEGFNVTTYLHGLGENVKIQDIYVKHIKDTIEKEKNYV